MSLELRIERARAEHERALGELFANNAVACHCQYWHFTGDKNEWQHRLALEPEKNRDALRASLQSGASDGVIALVGERVVGWLKLARAENVPKLYEQRLYRGLPCLAADRSGVFTVGCLLVDEPHRRQGVARALIRESRNVARALGARAIEAFPRGRAPGDDSDAQLSDAELWLGPLAVFLEAGFRVVSDFGPIPFCDMTSLTTSERDRDQPDI